LQGEFKNEETPGRKREKKKKALERERKA